MRNINHYLSHWLLVTFLGWLGSSFTLAQTLRTTYLGNSFSGADGKWVQNAVGAFYVAPDGTCYTQSVWDEGHTENAFYKDGDKKGRLTDLGGGFSVTGDGTYIFAGEGIEDDGTQGTVHRFHPDGSQSPFPSGSNVIEVPTSAKIYALAARNGELYVSDPNNNQILVYSATTGEPLRGFAFTRPGTLAVEPSGALWIVQTPASMAGSIRPNNPLIGPAKILRYTSTGTKLAQEITDVVYPEGIAIDAQGRLLVAESGPAQQIRVYKNLSSGPVLDPAFGNGGTFGDKFGVLSGVRGEVKPTKFYNLVGVGADSTGNLYVSMGGPHPNMETDIRKFNAALTTMEWQLLGKEFVDMGDTDPANENHFYTRDTKYVINHTETTPGAGWTFQAHTIDKFRYPLDDRVAQPGSWGLNDDIENVFMRRIGGKLFMFGNNMAGDQGPMRVWRFDSLTNGEVAVPSARIGYDDADNTWLPDVPDVEYIWRDLDGDGQPEANEYTESPLETEYDYSTGFWPDSQGNIWKAYREKGIRKIPCTGLDDKGNPIYAFEPRVYWEMPAPFDDVHEIRYFPETDVMYLAGWTTANPGPGGDHPNTIGTIVRYDHWSTADRRVVWQSNPSDYYDLSRAPSLDVAEDYVFTVEGIGQKVCIYQASTGKRVHSFVPDPAIVGEVGWIDIWDGGIRARKLATGEYAIYVEEDFHAKTILYHWTPPSEDQLVLTSPAANARYVASVSDTVYLKAYVLDTDQSLSKVSFFNADTLVAEVTSAPYQYLWKVPVGEYRVKAVAYNQAGVAVDTTVENRFVMAYLPDLTVTDVSWEPANPKTGEPLRFKATVKNVGDGPTPAGIILGGVWFVNGDFANFTDTYSTALAPGDSVVLTANGGGDGDDPGQWTPVASGSYTVEFLVDDVFRFTEVTRDNNTLEESLCVGKADGSAEVRLTSPQAGSLYETGDSITFEVEAFDCDGAVSKVAYYQGTTLLGESATAPFHWTWVNTLSPGTYAFTAVATNDEGKTSMSAAVSVQVAGPREPENPSATAAGIAYTYYELEDADGYLPDFGTIEPKDSGFVESFNLSKRKRDGLFAFRFTGFIDVPTEGVYTFYTTSDDGSKLYLGDELIVDNDGGHEMEEKSGRRTLKPGKHAIQVNYLQDWDSFGLEVWYEGPGIGKQQIPAAVLFHGVAPVVAVQLWADSVAGVAKTQVLVPIRVKQFKDLIGAQGTLSWDAEVASFTAVKDFGITGLTEANFSEKHARKGKLVFSWYDPNLTPQSLPDSTVLFAVQFKLIGPAGASTPLTFINNPVKLELIRSDASLAEVETRAGRINIQSIANLSGQVANSTGEPIKGVTLTLADGGKTYQTTTLPDGNYALSAPAGLAYSLTPTKKTDSSPVNGVSVLDLILIQRHILRIADLPSAYAVIAADVNGSGSVTTQDLVLIQSLILQEVNEYPNQRLWSFVDRDQTFADPSNPFPYDSTRTYAALRDTTHQDFVAVKLGDVNQTWEKPGGRTGAGGEITLALDDQMVVADSEIEIPVRTGQAESFRGYQFTFHWDPEVLRFVGLAESPLRGAYSIKRAEEGTVSTAWHQPGGGSLVLAAGETLVSARFRVIGAAGSQSAVQVSADPTPALVYNEGWQELKIASAARRVQVLNAEDLATKGYQLFQNQPNPFSGSTTIRFALPQPESVRIDICNTFGQVVKTLEGRYASGFYQVKWEAATGSVAVPGTYFCRMSAGQFVAVRKLVVY